MLGRSLLVALSVTSLTLAGCIGGTDGVEPLGNESGDEKLGFVDGNETAAPDGRGELSAFKESNRTVTNGTDAMMHAHDYWKGQTRMEIGFLDAGLIPLPLDPPGNPPPGTSIADFDIPPPALVWEGTDHLELNMIRLSGPTFCVMGTCSPDTPHPAVHVNFDYITAADEPGAWRNGGELKLNEPFIIPVKPTEADMPHQLKSLWIFRIYSSEPTWFEFNITITAVKGKDIVNWPPHPDLYADSPERTIYTGPVHLESRGTLWTNVDGGDVGWQNPERIISYGTDRIEIEVRDVKIDMQGAPVTPSYYLLEYHNATKPPLMGHGTQYGGRLQDTATDGTVWRFTIDVSEDPESYDTPYGTKSRWGFRFVPQFQDQATAAACIDDPFLQQLLVGCQFLPWKLDYTITIKAYGHAQGEAALPDPNA